MGENFNYVSLVTNVPSNAVIFPYPFPFAAPEGVTQIDCQYLSAHHSTWMVLSPEAVQGFGTSACGIYRPVPVTGVAFGQLQELQ